MGGVGGVFAGQVVLITGAGGAIGRALCVGFVADGATIVAVGRRTSTLDETAALCSRPITSICADLRQPNECVRAIEEAISKHGRIDVLVNCAGRFGAGLFSEKPFQEWADTIALNVLGVAACCRAALPHMMRQGNGRIITIASRMAGTRSPGASAYSASKAAASALTSCIGAELANSHPNLLINDLIPGPTKSAMSRQGQDPAAVYPYARKLALLPAGGPSGQMFYKGARYSLFGLRQKFSLSRWGKLVSYYLKRLKIETSLG
jgi:NAD(P)-dependent dehydrogenase (short-subunit alcohol dehydrogenase family)